MTTAIEEVSLTTVSPDTEEIVSTRAARDETLASTQADNRARREAWDSLIDASLIKWVSNPETFEEADLVPPSPKAIRSACEIARFLRDNGASPPTRIVPDAEGGVSLERSVGNVLQCLNVSEDGSITLLDFQDSRLMDRREIPEL